MYLTIWNNPIILIGFTPISGISYSKFRIENKDATRIIIFGIMIVISEPDSV